MSNSGLLEMAKAQGYDVSVLDLDRLDHTTTFDPLGEFKNIMERKQRKEHSYRKWKHYKPRKRLFIDEYHLLMDRPNFSSGSGMSHALVLPEKIEDKPALFLDSKSDKS